MSSSVDATRSSSSSGSGSDPDPDDVAPRAELARGERYEILAEHGRGGSGRVLRAYDRVLMRDVAIKELMRRSRGGEVRLFREAFVTSRLGHPRIPEIFDAGRWPDGTPYYAMQLVPGRPLSAAIASAPTWVARRTLLLAMPDVIAAVAYAHQRGVVHRDLKPSNVIVGPASEGVVIDWGLARQRNDASGRFGTPGVVVGTRAYMAPEQARGEEVDERADVYALGVMLFELCTGHRPRSFEPLAALTRHEIDPALAAVTARCLAPRAADRYDSAFELAVALARPPVALVAG
jgi:serine/threonine protein kinase